MPAPLEAQDAVLPSAVGTPEAVAGAFFDAVEGQRWTDAAALVHPAALARYHQESLANVRSAVQPSSRPTTTAEDLLRHDPQMPREVAEYQARRAAEGMQEHDRWALERAGVSSLPELEKLTPAESFARFLAANDERRAVQRAMAGHPDPVAGELLARAVPRNRRTVLGAVRPSGAGGTPDGELAYVVYSVALATPLLPETGSVQTSVVGVRRHGASWRMDPGEPMVHELLGGGNFGISFDVRAEGGPLDLADAVRRPAVWPGEGAPRLRVRMDGAGADPLRDPLKTLVLERLAADGTVLARVEVPAAAWESLNEVMGLWSLLILEPTEPGS